MQQFQDTARGIALTRAAEAMLRSLGGEEVTLLFPMSSLPDEPSAQLGLADPGVDQVTIAPVIVRNLHREMNANRWQLEFLMPGSAVRSVMDSRHFTAADEFFESALGITYEGHLLRIQHFETEFFAGTAYLYRVTAGE